MVLIRGTLAMAAGCRRYNVKKGCLNVFRF